MRTVKKTITVSGAADDIYLECEVTETTGAESIVITTKVKREILASSDDRGHWMIELRDLFNDAVNSYLRNA